MRFVGLVSVVVAFIFACVPCQADTKQKQKQMMKIGDDIVSLEAGRAFAKAQELISSKNYQQAETLLQSVVQEQPNLASVRYKYGFVLLQQGKNAEAIVQGKKCTELSPNFFGGWALIGEASMNLNLESDATAAYQKALDLQPSGENADIIREHLNELQEQKQQQAIDAANAIENQKIAAQNKVSMRLNQAISHCENATKLFGQKQFDDGLQECRTALSMAPDSAAIKENVVVYLNNYAADCVQKQQLKQAESLMKEAIALQNKGGVSVNSCLTTLKNYHALLAFLGRTDEANAVDAQMKSLRK
jgi:tetratricopeptide (TPR) repeat protein